MKYLFTTLLIMPTMACMAQAVNKTNIKGLDAPTTPIFQLTETAASLTETPATPKSFVLGIAQSFGNAEGGFPQNYSTEMAPYWWLRPKDVSVFRLLGFAFRDRSGTVRQNPFAGLKFSTLSLGLMNKDLIPDGVDATNKIAAAGFRTTIVRIQQKKQFDSIGKLVSLWHDAVLLLLSADDFQIRLALETDTAKQRVMLQQWQADTAKANTLLKGNSPMQIAGRIEDLMKTPPLFTWDLSGAHAVYGVGDSSWKSGRSGIWSSLGLNLPLNAYTGVTTQKYLNIQLALRFVADEFFQKPTGTIGQQSVFDIGGRIGFTFNAFSFHYEYFRRNKESLFGNSNRSVGAINYRLAPSLYLNGAFGKGFNPDQRLIALFGIRWGLGEESVPLPQQPAN